jgi:peptide chain release factor 2
LDLKKQQESPNFWDDNDNAMIVSKRAKLIQNKLDEKKELQSKIDYSKELVDLLNNEDDDGLTKELENLLKEISTELEDLKLKNILSGKYDALNAIVTIHAGAGGTEAQDWTNILFRMYTMYSQKYGYKMTVMDQEVGDTAGLKSVMFKLDGDYAYGYMKAEKGVHRLIRISPFDSSARRHTSFASVSVMPEIEKDDTIVINPDDIRIDIYRSSGAGGQKVNKTDTAIRITHFPTGIVVTCQNERSQLQNKEMAFKILKSRLAEIKEQQELEKLQQIKGNLKSIEWGSQIRSYVFCPYTLVKDHRTNYETSDVQSVLDGNIQDFMNKYLVMLSETKKEEK